MADRTPPAHIYTSSLSRRERVWARSRRERAEGPIQARGLLRRQPGPLRRVLSAIGGGLLFLALVAGLVLAASWTS